MAAPLHGRRILVTGGATGIGAAAVEVLTDAGAQVVATYHQTPPAPAVQTPGADRLREFLGPAAAEFIDAEIKKTIPLGGALGDPKNDLGPALVFFCSAGSHFMTGQLVAVDGGLVMLGA